MGSPVQEGDDLLSQWLANPEVQRWLQPAQRNEVLDKFNYKDNPEDPDNLAGNPLYLKLAFEEARLWRSGSGLPPENLEPGISGIIEKNMIDRLEKESSHIKELVSHALGYLAASRFGLTEDELVDLLSRDVDVYKSFFKKSYHLPEDLIRSAILYHRSPTEEPELQDIQPNQEEQQAAVSWLNKIRNDPEKLDEFLKVILPKAKGPRLPIVLWSRLSLDLAPYLSERLLDGSSLLYFYHRELGDVSKTLFLGNGNDKIYHEKLAEYFRAKADPIGDRSWNGHHLHGLRELPYHLTAAENMDELFHTLTDFKFLEHKAEEVGIQTSKDENGILKITSDGVLQLQDDYERALAKMPGGDKDFAGRAPLILTALETSKGLMVYCPVCNKASPIDKKMLDTVITCPQDTCNTPIKLNSFTVKREI